MLREPTPHGAGTVAHAHAKSVYRLQNRIGPVGIPLDQTKFNPEESARALVAEGSIINIVPMHLLEELTAIMACNQPLASRIVV